MSRAKELVGNLAQTNHYLVSIPIPEKVKTHIQKSYPEDTRSSQVPKFVTEKLGLLCSDASLPTSSYATAEVKDNFMGITQEFAHTRLYTDLDFTFYVDNDYTVMRFFEGWMDYISGGGEFAAASDSRINGFRRFNFPNHYKVQNMEIFKFEKDYKTVLSYQFVNAFPKGLTPVPISYGGADLLKVTVNFNYDRYLVKRRSNDVAASTVPRASESLDPSPEVPNILGNTQTELDRIRSVAAINTLNNSKTPGMLDRVLSGNARSEDGRRIGDFIFNSF